MDPFNIPPKGASNDQLAAWRKLTLVLNSRRRFRYAANLKKRDDQTRLRLSAAILATRAKFRFATAGARFEDAARININEEEEKAKGMGFATYPQELASLTSADVLRSLGGVEEIAEKLRVSLRTGICGDELDLEKRIKVYGSNIPDRPSRGFFKIFISFVWDAMHDKTLLIRAAFTGLWLIIDLSTIRQTWLDAIWTFVAIIISGIVIGTFDNFQSRPFQGLEEEKKKIYNVLVLRNGEKSKRPIYGIVVGDVVQLSIGDRVPGDGLYICGHSLTIKSSMGGGEACQVVDEERPFILSGSEVEDGSGTMLITAVGMNTEWGRQMAELCERGEDETPLEVKLNGVATRIAKIGLVFQIAGFIVNLVSFIRAKKGRPWSSFDGIDFINLISNAISIVAVAVPENLPLTVSDALAYATKKLLAKNALVRRRAACETIASVSYICIGKTGILTTNEMIVTKAWIGGNLKDVAETAELGLHDTAKEMLLESIFRNTTGEVKKINEEDVFQGTPTETALLRFGKALGGGFEIGSSDSKLACEPFNSSRMRMGVVIKSSDGNIRAHWKGAAEIVLNMCNSYMDCKGHIIRIEPAIRKDLEDVIKSLGDEALRTLCLAVRNLEIEPSKHDPIDKENFTCLAIVGIKNPVCPDVRKAVETCRSAGIKVKMVTGDNIHTANAIARECGILTNEEEESIDGPEFQKLPKDEQIRRIPTIQVMARAQPTHKYELVKGLRQMNKVVAVAANGTNDVPVLHEADIAVAMGISGTEIAKGSADIVLLDDKFETLVTTIKWGRSVYLNIQKACHFQLVVTILTALISFTSSFSDNAPLNVTRQTIWVDIISYMFGTLALVSDPPCKELMKLPPLGRQDGLITKIMCRNISILVVYHLVVLSFLQYKGKDMFKSLLVGDEYDYVFDTLVYNSFVLCLVFNVIISRRMERFNVFSKLFHNRAFVLVVALMIYIQYTLVQYGLYFDNFLQTTPLDGWQWLISIVIGFLSWPIAMVGTFVPEVWCQWLIIIVIGFLKLPIAMVGNFVPEAWWQWLISIVVGIPNLSIVDMKKFFSKCLRRIKHTWRPAM